MQNPARPTSADDDMKNVVKSNVKMNIVMNGEWRW